MNNCKNCNAELNEKFCSNCWNPNKLRRINGQYILSEISSILNLDKGIFYTIKRLIIRPGTTIHEFIHHDRNRLVKPLMFIIISSLIYTLLKRAFHFEDGYVNYTSNDTNTTETLFLWVQNNYGYANVIMGMFIAFWIKIFFRNYEYNFYEILILLCFVMGVGMLIFSIFGIIDGLLNVNTLQFGGVLAIVYTSWAIGQFFDRTKKINYLKAFFAYFIGMLFFSFSILVLGYFIDLLN
jgi:hypothetical protein